MEENNNFEHIIDGIDESGKITEEINQKIFDEFLKTTAVSEEYERPFDFPWMTKSSWWNDASSQR